MRDTQTVEVDEGRRDDQNEAGRHNARCAELLDERPCPETRKKHCDHMPLDAPVGVAQREPAKLHR